MLSIPYADLLQQQGFHLIGRLDYRLHLTIWWHPQKLIQIVVLTIGRIALIKGDKSYFLKSISAEGETWVRDIPGLHDYLETHFPELRLSFSSFRNVPAPLAQAEVNRRMMAEAPTLPLPTVEAIAQLQEQLLSRQREITSTEQMLALSTSGPDLLGSYMRQQTRTQRGQMEQLQVQIDHQQQRLSLLQHLQHEYQQKGSAASYSFSISSNVLFAEDPPRFRDALGAIVKELLDMDRYQVSQKLGGGKLNIQVGHAQEPAIVWLEQWFGGALAEEINTLQNVAFHALLEIGISRTEALAIVDHTQGHTSEAAIMGMILTKLASATDPVTASVMQKIGQLVACGKTFRHIAAIDLNVPWSGPLTHVIKHQMDGQAGLKWGAWTRIPNIAITSLKLAPGRTVTDRKHHGFEFLILTEGSGIFDLKSVGQVSLSKDQRQIIAYRPTHLHGFTAGPHGASLYVVSYLRSGDESHDPIDELIKATELEARV